MAKKKAKDDFNMSEEIRNVLRDDRSLSVSETLAALKEKFPKQDINENSFSVAFYNARNKLGIKSGKRRKKAGKAAKRTVMRKKPTTAEAVSYDDLQAAAKFLNQFGDADKAIAAIKQVKALQIK